MNIRRLTIEGLRGSPAELELRLDGKSLVLHAENGHGKSTMTDALELWSEGDLAAYHHRGLQLDAAIHIDASEARVTVDVAGEGPYQRTLRHRTATPLEPVAGEGAVLREAPADDVSTALKGLPMLRHETMGRFMSQTPGEKKRELLVLLGLEALTPFRDELKTACNNVQAKRKAAKQLRDREQDGLETTCEDRPLLATAEHLRRDAQLPTEIRTEADLAGLDFSEVPAAQGPNRPAMVAELKASLAAVDPDPAQDWNELVADPESKAVDTLFRLVETGRQSLGFSEEDVCPLCASPYERELLERELAQRAAALNDKQQEISSRRDDLERSSAAVTRISRAISALLSAVPQDGWSVAAELESARSAISGYLESNAMARRELIACDQLPQLPSSDVVAAVEAQAEAAAGSAATAAMLRLKGIKDQHARRDDAQCELDRLITVQRSADRMLAIAEEQIETTIRDALDGLSDLIGKYFNELAYGGLYSNIDLRYDPAYSGGIEFSVMFDGRKQISPPQAIMSTSQLNALGLALFLARAKKREPTWRTLVLDDVVNSFDSSFRQGLIRILASDFSDWQVLLLTHDRAFADIVQRETGSGWRHKQIVRWTPAGGPIFAEGDARKRLRELLNEGASAAECAGWARQALEQGLGYIVAKLEYEVPYRPAARYSAGDFVRALRKGLARGNSELAASPVLARIEGDNYMAALGVHGREDASALSAEDFRRLADDLDDLDQLLTCPNCGESVWKAESGSRHTCQCSKLAA